MVGSPAAAPDPWFAVTMTIRNNRRTIERSFASILPQVAQGGELVVVDARSSDGTSEYLDRLAADHPGLRVEHRACNRGIGRNLAVELSRAPVVLTQVDADDEYAPGVLVRVAQHVADHAAVDAAFAVGASDWDPSSTRFYAWRRAAFQRAGGYPDTQEREDPPLLLRAFRAGLTIDRCYVPKVADDLKPRREGRAPTVSPWRRSYHTRWAARKFRVMGYHYPEYVRLLRLTRRTATRFVAGVALGGFAYVEGAVHRDGPEVLVRDDEPVARRTGDSAPVGAGPGGP